LLIVLTLFTTSSYAADFNYDAGDIEGNKYDDPSYGISASSLTSYRNAAIAGWIDLETSFGANNVSSHILVPK
jgi:hypothetical protein